MKKINLVAPSSLEKSFERHDRSGDTAAHTIPPDPADIRVQPGERRTMTAEVSTLCCMFKLPARSTVTVVKQTSKNRVMVLAGTGYHKVRLSTFMDNSVGG